MEIVAARSKLPVSAVQPAAARYCVNNNCVEKLQWIQKKQLANPISSKWIMMDFGRWRQLRAERQSVAQKSTIFIE